MSEQDISTPIPAVSVSIAKQVIYCGVCSLPPEYCEYGATLNKCKEWLREKHSDLFDNLYSQTNLESDMINLSLEKKPANDAEDKKKAKEAAKIEREMQKKMASKITITRIARNKRKSVTNVCGLQNFDIDLKKAAKSFASKFACGSSVVKNNQGNDEIVIQGDVSDDLYDYILETWPDVPEDNIELVEEKKSKK
ncbi:translation initiation factor SUI1 [Glomus cerebriforme]|uniref:Translation machinery-associated protein 22 n=1 Tax=Glomus cerebriforme TaxID=658196 RepID=A0A397TJT7_9GLOM|nr:translation initiation factor SUI1 [Glomus cerebriforme]